MGGRLTTPTGRLVLPSSAPRADWLAARRDGITATDIVAIVGENPYTTPVDVWLDKTSDLPPADDMPSEAAMWGIDLEDVVAQRWAEMHGMAVRRVGLLAKDGDDWMRASLDRIVKPGCNPDGACGLEVKTRNAWVADQWDAGVPASVVTQVQWQMAVSGLGHIHVAALIGGQRLVDHVVNRDEDTIDALTATASRFWVNVLARELPDIDPALWTAADLDRLYPDRSGEREVDPTIVQPLLAACAAAEKKIKPLHRAMAEARVALIALLGDADTAVVDGKPVYTFRGVTYRDVDRNKLAADFPEAWESCTSTRITRTFRISKRGTK